MLSDKTPAAFLFDLNGTMIDDMQYHIKAWHAILNNLGANLTMEQMKLECYGKNEELLERIFPNKFSVEEKAAMSLEKEKAYQKAFLPELMLIKGLHDFLKTASSNSILMAIGSAAIMYNIDFVLDGLNIRPFFTAIVSADDVALSKPNAETYLKCANQLNVTHDQCIVFEDSPKGVQSAANAGMQCVVITTMHTREEFSEFNNVICFVNDYSDTQLNKLFTN